MKKSHIIGLLIIVIAIGAILSTVADSSTYETFASASESPGKEFHVVGQYISEKGFEYDPVADANLFSFFMADADSTERKVIFKGAKPQDFERSEQIVLTGKMVGDEFIASKILMKCPSKYTGQDENIAEAVSGT
jgi:cytochrome c-type biogenesis protein CcmE